jgi:hypothetical protein
MIDKHQAQRFERKYFVSQARALQIREFLRRYMVPDDYSETRPNYSYPIHSLYLDSDELTTYWATVHGEKSRFKIRLRFYDDNPDTPVFFEVKRRVGDCIIKQRAAVRKNQAAMLVAGQYPEPGHLMNPKPSHLVAVQKFSELMQGLGAQPKLHVAYLREAWVSSDNNFLRVTWDRDLRASIEHHVRLTTQMLAPTRTYLHPNDNDPVILELKYTHHFPEWYRDLVCLFNLVQSGAPKYCGSIIGMGEERVSAAGQWNTAKPRMPW